MAGIYCSVTAMSDGKSRLRLGFFVFSLVALTLASLGCGNSNSPKPVSPTSPTSPTTASNPPTTFSYVNNPASNNVSGLAVNNQNSSGSAIPGSPFSVAAYPVDVATFGNFVFVASTGVNALNASEFVLTTFNADATTGALTSSSVLNVGTMFNGGYPSHIAVDPSGKFLYMSIIGGSLTGGSNTGPRIGVFTIDANSGALTEVTTNPFAPALPFTGYRMVISPNGKFLYAAATVGTGSSFGAPPQGVQAIARDPNSGTLSSSLPPLTATDAIEALAMTPSGEFLVGTDVSRNQVLVWSVDPNSGALTQASVFGDPQTTTMVAPRGIAIDPSGKFVLVANSQSSDVSVLSLSSSGTLTPVTGSPFPAGSGPTSVAFSASGKLVFVGNVGSNNMSVYQFDSSTGALTQIQGSPFPIGTSAFNLMTVVTIH